MVPSAYSSCWSPKHHSGATGTLKTLGHNRCSFSCRLGGTPESATAPTVSLSIAIAIGNHNSWVLYSLSSALSSHPTTMQHLLSLKQKKNHFSYRMEIQTKFWQMVWIQGHISYGWKLANLRKSHPPNSIRVRVDEIALLCVNATISVRTVMEELLGPRYHAEVIGVQSVEKREKGMRATKGNRTRTSKVRHKLEGASNLVVSSRKGDQAGIPETRFHNTIEILKANFLNIIQQCT